mgnify:CR=1 FL=1
MLRLNWQWQKGRKRGEGEDNMEELGILSEQISRIVIETDEENPVTIAVITKDLTEASSGYRIRMTPVYD